MNFLFKVDSSSLIGSGHLSRSISIAKELFNLGHNITFFSRSHQGNANHLIPDIFTVIEMEVSLFANNSDYATWLGVPKEQDIEDIKSIIISKNIDLVFIDHYGPDFYYFSEISKKSKVVYIDDLLNKEINCDYIINYNLDITETNYSLINKNHLNCRYLLGPKFTPLNSQLSPNEPNTSSPAEKHLLIYFGHGDITNETLKAVKAYEETESKLKCVIVLNEKHSTYDDIMIIVNRYQNVTLLSFTSDMNNLLKNTFCAFGSAGVSLFERSAFGIPSFCILSAENQQKNIQDFKNRDAIFYVGDGRTTNERDWIECFKKINDSLFLNQLAQNASKICDTIGAKRIALALSPLTKRPASESDLKLFFNWVNESTTRKNSFNSDPVSLENHTLWFKTKIKDLCTHMLVYQVNSIPVAQVRIDVHKKRGTISFSVDPKFRGLGVGNNIIHDATNHFWDETDCNLLTGEVKKDNLASRKTFINASYSETEMADKFIYSISRPAV